jgi:hypothetical protein
VPVGNNEAVARRAEVQLSVIIPTLGRPTLIASVESALVSAAGVRTEVLIVDDRSEGTREAFPLAGLLFGIGSRDATVNLLVGPAEGAAAARNVALDQVRGEWVAFLDDDDLVLPAHLPSLLRSAQSTGAPLAHSGVLIRLPDGRQRLGFGWPANASTLQVANVIPPSSALVRREGLVERFDPGLATLEDWCFWLELTADGSTAYTGLASCVHRHRPRAVEPTVDEFVRLRRGLSSVAANYRLLCERFPSQDPTILAGRQVMIHNYEEWLEGIERGARPRVDHYEAALAVLFGPPAADDVAPAE